MATKTWARIVGQQVAELSPPLPDDWLPGRDIYSADQTWVDATTVEGVTPGWDYNGTSFSAPAPPAPTVAQLTAYANDTWAKLLAVGRIFDASVQGAQVPVGTTSAAASTSSSPIPVLCDGTNDTRADLALLALYGQANPTGSKTWIDNDGIATTLTGPQLVSLATQAGHWISATYPARQALLAAITASPPSITTYAAIDAFVWPTS